MGNKKIFNLYLTNFCTNQQFSYQQHKPWEGRVCYFIFIYCFVKVGEFEFACTTHYVSLANHSFDILYYNNSPRDIHYSFALWLLNTRRTFQVISPQSIWQSYRFGVDILLLFVVFVVQILGSDYLERHIQPTFVLELSHIDSAQCEHIRNSNLVPPLPFLSIQQFVLAENWSEKFLHNNLQWKEQTFLGLFEWFQYYAM